MTSLPAVPTIVGAAQLSFFFLFFGGSVSTTVVVTAAVFEIVPFLPALTTMVTVATPPSARSPSSHVTVTPAREQDPVVGFRVAEKKVTLPGRVSVTTTLVASAVPPLPRLRIWIV